MVGSRSRRRGVSVTLLAASGMVLAGLLAAAVPAAAANTPFNTNLTRNPGAENGVNAWDAFPSGAFVAHGYGPAGFGFPPKSEGKRIGGGAHFFTSLNDPANVFGCGDAKQDISLTGIGGAIDNGHVKVQIKGYAATNGAAEMRAHFDLQFFNSEHHTDNISSWGIKKQALSTNETYRTLKTSMLLPAHTRIVQIHLYQTPGDDSVGCQSSWDNLSVKLIHA